MIKETEELCERCGYPVHPCLPCEEVIALNEDFEEDDSLPPLPIPRSKINDLKRWSTINDPYDDGYSYLITNRHKNIAIRMLGKTYRVSTNPPNKYPEIGAVESQNAQRIVSDLLAELEYVKKISHK